MRSAPGWTQVKTQPGETLLPGSKKMRRLSPSIMNFHQIQNFIAILKGKIKKDLLVHLALNRIFQNFPVILYPLLFWWALMKRVYHIILIHTLILTHFTSEGTKLTILKLRNEIRRELIRRDLHHVLPTPIPISVVNQPPWTPNLQEEEKALNEFLFALKNAKHLDASLFNNINAILIEKSSGSLRLGETPNGNNYLYIPTKTNAGSMLRRLSTKKDLERLPPTEDLELSNKETKDSIEKMTVDNHLREIKMECHYSSPPVQIEVSSCARDQNHICASSGWCIDARGVNISFPSITCRTNRNTGCPDAKVCLLGKTSTYFDPEVMTDMPYKLPKKSVPDKIFDKAVR